MTFKDILTVILSPFLHFCVALLPHFPLQITFTLLRGLKVGWVGKGRWTWEELGEGMDIIEIH